MTSRVAPRVLAWTVLVAAGCPTGETNPSLDGGDAADGADDGTTDASATQPESGPSDGSDDGPATDGETTETSAEDPDDDSSDDGTTGVPCTPTDETCDGLDDDCDGEPDDGNPGGGEPCDTRMAGVCATGETVCTDGAIACLPVARSTPELCDGLDNDCDAAVDEDDPEGGTACATGLFGVCATGVEHCQKGAIACVQDVLAGDDVCDGLDNDCDDAVDEDDPGGGAPCDTGLLGVCAAGTQTCLDGSVQCVQDELGDLVDECANDLDDDCDGEVDENCACEHDLCAAGDVLVEGCDPCVTAICDADPFCCSTGWDGVCINEVRLVCGSAECLSPSCAHLVCSTGGALASGCDPCVTAICGSDPFCCSSSWDSICVSEVGSICGLTC